MRALCFLLALASGLSHAADEHAVVELDASPPEIAQRKNFDLFLGLRARRAEASRCGGDCGPICTSAKAQKLAEDCDVKYPGASRLSLGNSQWALVSVTHRRQLWYNFEKRILSEDPAKDSPQVRELLAESVPKDVRHALEHRWMRDQSIVRSVAMYPIRLVPRLVLPLVKGRTMQTLVLNPLHGLYHLAGALKAEDVEQKHDLLDKAAYDFADPIAPLVVGNRVVADVTQALKAPVYAQAKMTSRIKLCSANLMTGIVDPSPGAPFKMPKFAYRVAPLLNAISVGDHVFLSIDDLLYETDDPSPTKGHGKRASDLGGIFCTSVPLLKDQSESTALECVRCLDGFFNTPEGHMPYRVDRYNCAAYTKDLLKMCGMGFAGSPNFGVGNELGFSYDKVRGVILERGRQHCMRKLEDQRDLIFATESGKDISQSSPLKSLDGTGPDFRLQMIVSAARGKNSASRQWVAQSAREIDFNRAYLKKSSQGIPEIKPSTESFLEDAFVGIDSEAYDWMRANFPQTAALYEQYCSAKKIDPRTQKHL